MSCRIHAWQVLPIKNTCCLQLEPCGSQQSAQRRAPWSCKISAVRQRMPTRSAVGGQTLCLPRLLPEASLRRIGTAERPCSGSPATCPLGYGEILAAPARAAWVRGCLGRGCQQRESLANHALGQAGHEGDLGDRVALVGKLTDDPQPVFLLQSARTARPRWRGISRGACRWTRFEAPHSRPDRDMWQMGRADEQRARSAFVTSK